MPHNPRLRFLARLWLVCVLAGIAALVALSPHKKIETNVLALLPDGAETQIPAQFLSAATQRIDKQLLWLVSDDTGGTGEDPAQAWFRQLEQLPELRNIAAQIDDAQQAAWAKFTFQYRAQILDTGTREKLANPEKFAAQIPAQIYSPFAGITAGELRTDPLLLMRAQHAAGQKNAGTLRLKNNWLTATDAAGRSWKLITAELRTDSFNINAGAALCEKLETLQSEFRRQFPRAEILQHGVLFYSRYAAEQARHDIATIGTASLLGVIALLLLFFRSAKPIALTLLSMSVGFVSGAVALFLIFGNAHIITLALGTSIVGLSLDYAIHYLTERMIDGTGDTPHATLKKLFPALAMALATTVGAYLTLLIAPFPALRQLAVFAAFGLSASFITVVLWFPFLEKNMPRRHPRPLAGAVIWLKLWQTKKTLRIGLPLVLAGAAAVSVFQIQANDDIANLQGFPPEFKERERRVNALIGQTTAPTFFLVHAGDTQQLLEKLETLEPFLSDAKNQKKLSDFRIFTEQLPSLARQKENFRLVTNAAGTVRETLREAEIEIAGEPYAFSPLTPEAWTNSPVSRGRNLLLFDFAGEGAVAVVPVFAAVDDAMRECAEKIDGVRWINRRAEISEIFALHRVQLTKFLAGALVFIAVLFSFRFGLRQGLINTIPIILAVGAALTALVVCGLSLNLFSVLALILVLGIGIDYTLFYANPNARHAVTTLSVLVAALTTQFSFGMLAFSSTPVIATFGIILAAGITVAFLLAPLAHNQK